MYLYMFSHVITQKMLAHSLKISKELSYSISLLLRPTKTKIWHNESCYLQFIDQKIILSPYGFFLTQKLTLQLCLNLLIMTFIILFMFPNHILTCK